jgi:CPA2 family monovalent cation:H+ antiporter-2
MEGSVDAHDFLRNLAVVLGVAGLTTVVSQRLRLPVVFGYLLAGMIVGPHVPIPVSVDEGMVRTLSELGVILLMYSLGLEFTLRRVAEIGATAGLAALAETSLMFGLGYAAGGLLGWSATERLFAGALVAISSTTIVARTFAEQKVQGRLRDVVFGILVIEDLIAITLIAVLSAVAGGRGPSAVEVGLTAVRLATFLVVLMGVGLLIVPRLMRHVVRLDRAEITVVTGVGVCFAAALLALGFGYSVALGAFIAGALVAESGHGKRLEELIAPLRDVFVAIFFVSVGMLIDPRVVLAQWPAVLGLTLVVVGGKAVAVTVGTFLTGSGLRESVRAGLSLAQIGEFSFIIAGVGLATGATRPFLYPVAVAVSAVTTLLTPWMVRRADGVAQYVDRKLPRALQTFAALYGSWIERLRATPDLDARTQVRRLVRRLLVDLVLLAGLVVAAAAEMGRFAVLLEGWLGVDARVSRRVVVGVALAAAVPFVYGIIGISRSLAVALALRALPTVRGLDRAAAPRGALVATLQLAILLAAAVPLLALLQPFLPGVPLVAVLVALGTGLAVAVWRSAGNLHGHARAGAEVIALAFTQHDRATATAAELTQTMEQLAVMLPGLGEPEPVRLTVGSPAIGRSLRALDLRGRTGATVLAITRPGRHGGGRRGDRAARGRAAAGRGRAGAGRDARGGGGGAGAAGRRVRRGWSGGCRRGEPAHPLAVNVSLT